MTSTLTFDIFARDRASGTFNKFGDAVKSTGDATEKAGGKVSGFGGKIGGLVGKLGIAGAALGGITATIAGIGEAMDREVVNDRLAASLGATPKMAEKMGRISSRLYAGAWGESMDEVAHAVEAAATSFDGLSAGGLQKASRQAMDYSKIFEVDLPKATMVAGQAVKTSLAKNATEAFDLMTAASQRVPASLREDVLDAGHEYGQFFATLGFSGEQAFGMLAKGAEKGTYGIDKVGDAIKEFTIRATDGSTASTDAYKAIGLNAEDMANKIVKGGKGAATATSDIVSGLLKMKDPAKQAQTAIALFGTPLEDLNVKDIPDFLKSMQAGTEGMDKWKGSIDRAGDTLNDNAATKIETFKRSVQTAFVDFLGGKAIPVIERFADFLGAHVMPVVEKAGEWFKTKLLPPLRDFAEKWAAQASDRMQALKSAFEDAKPFFKLVGDILANVVLPALGKLLDAAGPVLNTAIRAVGKSLGFVGEKGEWMWEKVLRPTISKILGAFETVAGAVADMLDAMSKAPGMGWAEKAADKLRNMADKAGAADRAIRNIPSYKQVSISINFLYPKGKPAKNIEDTDDWVNNLGNPRARATAKSVTTQLMEALADGIKSGGKKLDKVLDASRERIKTKLSGIRDEMRGLAESVASALNNVDFGGTLEEHLASLTGTNGALTNLMAVFQNLKDGASKGYLSSLMQSGNIGLATALANDPAALAQASSLYDANAAMSKGLGEQTAQTVMSDRITKALADETAKLLQELKDAPGKTARELRKEIKELRLVVEGLSAGQKAHLRGAWNGG